MSHERSQGRTPVTTALVVAINHQAVDPPAVLIRIEGVH